MNLADILERLEESKNLSKDLSAYGETKGVGITSARRLAEFLGPEVIRGKSSLCCYYIISAYPPKRTVTERAIPTQIFYADDELQKKYIYMWTKESRFRERVDIKDILDWGYYK
jgi:DNA polymerase epsilon subunit 1